MPEVWEARSIWPSSTWKRSLLASQETRSREAWWGWESQLPWGEELCQALKVLGPQSSIKGKTWVKLAWCEGFKQRDPLSPILFNFILDEVISEIDWSSIGVPLNLPSGESKKVSVLPFADDIVLVAQTESGLQELIDNVITYLAQTGLQVNPAKCLVFQYGAGW